MALTAAQVKAEVDVDTKKAEAGFKGMGERVKESHGLIGSFLGRVGEIAGGMAIVDMAGKAFDFLKDQIVDSVRAAADQQAVMAQTQAVLKSTAGAAHQNAAQVQALAEHWANLTGVQDDVVQSAENILLTFTNIKGEAFNGATEAVMNLSTAMHEDLQSAAVQVGKALNDPLKGMTALQRVGVTFDAEQKKLIKTYEAHGQAAKAQQIILAELAKEFGGSAAAAGQTFAGKMAILGEKLNELKEKIGGAIIPIIMRLADTFMPIIDALANGLEPALSAVSLNMTGTFAPSLSIVTDMANRAHEMFQNYILPVLQTLGHIIMDNVVPAVLNIWRSIADNLLPALERLWAKLSPVLIPVLNVLGWVLQNIVGPAIAFIIGALGKLIDVISWLLGKLGDFLGFLGRIKDALGGVASAIGGAFSHLPHFASGGIMAASGLALVGERGPELVALPGGAHVYNAQQSAGMMSGSSQSGSHKPGVHIETLNVYGSSDPLATARAVDRELQWRQSLWAS